MDVSNPNGKTATASRRSSARRWLATSVVVLIAAGASVAGPLELIAPAGAAQSSEVTVKWTEKDQPARNVSSPHYSDFKNLSVSVSQTTDLIDQAIKVSVTGFTGTKSKFNVATNAMNFLQAMQCWGDPTAADFRQTCQWGGLYSGNGVGTLVYPDNILRVSPRDNDPRNLISPDNPFKTVSGVVVPGKSSIQGAIETYPILQYFSPSTTNEVVSARVAADGTGSFDFETQSSNQAPQLGCGSANHLKCWLVIVPRGSHYGGSDAGCTDFTDPLTSAKYSYGDSNAAQVGSPVNPLCDYFENRIVVPLDFTPTGVSCKAGNAEFRVSGSQLMVGAMSSWQPSLCQKAGSTFSFATNSDAIARAQLLDTGVSSPQIVYCSYPLSSGELQSEDERSRLAKATLAYTPVAVSSIVVAFIADLANGRQENLVISPRLMAKLLTQSYRFTVPANTSDPAKNVAHLSGAARSYNYFARDPDFQALNSNFALFDGYNPSIVLPGPGGADGINQVWRWILADKDAVSFLDGKPDPWGMTINPYYLPKGDLGAVVPWYLDSSLNYIDTPVQKAVGQSSLDGSPQKLSASALNYFPKDDESLVPLKLNNEKSRFDSLQFAPYANDFLSGARRAFRGDPSSKTVWDPTKVNASGDVGDWVSGGLKLPGNKFMIAITDSNSAATYSLSTAAVTIPNSTATIKSTPESMAAALGGLRSTSLDSVKQVDPPQVPAGGYPMTMVTYAAVNLGKTTASSRTLISAMLKQITTEGQVGGTAIGQLPPAYLPLTGVLADQAAAARKTIDSYAPTSISTTTTSSTVRRQDSVSGDSSTDIATLAAGTSDAKVTPGVDQQAGGLTPASNSSPLALGALAIALVVGLLGFIVAPVLFRGRGFF